MGVDGEVSDGVYERQEGLIKLVLDVRKGETESDRDVSRGDGYERRGPRIK